jgi:hypothetical protein
VDIIKRRASWHTKAYLKETHREIIPAVATAVSMIQTKIMSGRRRNEHKKKY